MYKILIVDDEEQIRSLIRKYALFEGYQVQEAKTGLEAIKLFREEESDFIIMDVMMPELDGFSAAAQIRKDKEVPILMLSARGEEYDKLHGFEIGVDDYLVKPFSPRELMMRVKTILRRWGKNPEDPHEIFEKEGLLVDFTARKVLVDNEESEMSPKEYELLFYLIRNKDRALNREQIIQGVWGHDFFGDERTLDTHIKLLRKSLGKYGKWITTLRSVGYRFEG